MNFLDLFSGIGGFALGARWAGLKFENHFNSDIDEYCNRVYSHHFPESIQLGDIKQIDGRQLKEKYGDEWIITGGFPCQDVSSAGKKRGLEEGTRSGLWLEYARLIKEIQPKACIIENVRGLFNRGFTRVLRDLADIGFDAEWRTLRAADYGLPHNRQRCWIIAHAKSDGRSAVAESSSILRDVGEVQQPDGISNWLALWLAGQRSATERALRSQPFISARPDGLSDRVAFKRELARVKAIGNSICPIIACDIFKRIKETVCC